MRRSMLTVTLAGAVLAIGAARQDQEATVHRFDGLPLITFRIEREAPLMMADAKVNGLAVAVIDNGQVAFVRAWGKRNVEKELPLQADTIMYGASLTKFAFAYMVMQLVDEGKIALDQPIAGYLPKPLPDYEPYGALKGDERWRRLTPRMLLTHSSGFANFAFLEPDEKLRFHFDPGTRYAYSGEGINLLQFVLETGLGLNVGAEMQRRVFDRFGMARTSMTWRPDFADNVADGYNRDGAMTAHSRRSRPRAAGSMDTTIIDIAAFVAGFSRGEGLSAKSRAEMVAPHVAITSPAQFPTLAETTSPAMQAIKLSAGLGVVTFDGPDGHVFFKGGHDDTTGNQVICLDKARRCIVYLSNDVRAERLYQRLTEATIGDPGMPWSWESYTPYR
jgi:CubicO group peptidase (beta-lactamase class C family)